MVLSVTNPHRVGKSVHNPLTQRRLKSSATVSRGVRLPALPPFMLFFVAPVSARPTSVCMTSVPQSEIDQFKPFAGYIFLGGLGRSAIVTEKRTGVLAAPLAALKYRHLRPNPRGSLQARENGF
jgi:hypothetical protein